jgi:hypothetical protein
MPQSECGDFAIADLNSQRFGVIADGDTGSDCFEEPVRD